MADRLNLSDGTRKELKRTISQLRNDLFLPRIRSNYAAKLPQDFEYRDCDFAVRFGTLVNLKVVDILTEKERERVADFIRTSSLPEDLMRALDKLAPLPSGIVALRKFTVEQPRATEPAAKQISNGKP